MSLADYAGLKASVASWLARSDLTTAIPDFVTLAEARMGRDVRSQNRIKTASFTTVSRAAALPADCVALIDVQVSSNGLETSLPPLPPSLTKNEALGPFPIGYEVREDSMYLVGAASDYSGTFRYHATIPALSDSNTTNWLLTLAPDLYLYATLLAAQAYLKGDARLAVWEAGYQTALTGLNAQEDRARWPSVPRMQVDFCAP
jgi:hypothetical protein